MRNEHEEDAAKKVFKHRLKRILGNHAENAQVILLLVVVAILIGALSGLLMHYMSRSDETIIEPQVETIAERKTYSVMRHSTSGELNLQEVSFCCQTESTSIEACETAGLLDEKYSCRLAATVPSQVSNTCTIKCSDLN